MIADRRRREHEFRQASPVYKGRRRRRRDRPYSRDEIFSAYGALCAYCDAPAEHLDHVVALALGGADAPHNLLPACAPCNLSKSDKTLAAWAATFGAEPERSTP